MDSLNYTKIVTQKRFKPYYQYYKSTYVFKNNNRKHECKKYSRYKFLNLICKYRNIHHMVLSMVIIFGNPIMIYESLRREMQLSRNEIYKWLRSIKIIDINLEKFRQDPIHDKMQKDVIEQFLSFNQSINELTFEQLSIIC